MATTHAATKSAERLYDAMVERTAMSVSILRNLGSSGGHGRGANAATQLASLLFTNQVCCLVWVIMVGTHGFAHSKAAGASGHATGLSASVFPPQLFECPPILRRRVVHRRSA